MNSVVAIYELAAGIWVLLVALGIVLARLNALPIWLTSNTASFPLNTLMWLTGIYIGFLVAISDSRAERANREMLAAIHRVLSAIESDEQTVMQEGEQILELERMAELTSKDVKTLLVQNTALTQLTHDHVRETHTIASDLHVLVQEIRAWNLGHNGVTARHSS